MEVSVGEVVRTQPVEIQAVPDHHAAEFSITGGLGYVPVTIKGLGVHDGGNFKNFEDGNWEKIDQSVIGKDFWQARFDEHSRTYEVVYNIPNRGTNRYRLIDGTLGKVLAIGKDTSVPQTYAASGFEASDGIELLLRFGAMERSINPCLCMDGHTRVPMGQYLGWFWFMAVVEPHLRNG